jgi:23S rRNA (uracil1939-C5)-methyltransferase
MAGTNRVGRWLGLHAPGRFDRVVDLEECPLMSAGMNRVFKSIRQDVLSNVWPIWNHREAAGFWRHLVVREGENGVIASLHTTTGTAEQQSWLLERAQAWGAAGVRWLQNDAVGDAVGGTISCLHGDTIVVEHLAGIEFRLSADAFFQVNREGAELLVATIGRLAGMGKTLLDLYCGTGAIGLGLASQFERVIGIELFEPSVVAARENAARNGVMAEYYCGAVEEVIKTLVIPEKPVVVVDPPRAGLHPKALAFLAGLDAEALVYVACKPASLVRDRLVLEGAGWTLSEWVAVDMFPQTGHVEVVARFEPQGTQRTQRTQRIGDYLGCSPTE